MAGSVNKSKLGDVVDSQNDEPIRSVPQLEWKRFIEIPGGVAAIAVGRNEFFVAVENCGDILRFDLNTLEEKKNQKIVIPDLDTPWDMTAINSDELFHTYVFLLDNLHGKIYQINVPHSDAIPPDKYVTKVWTVPLSETVSLSSDQHRLLIAGITNKILEYSLSTLLIISSSSSSSSSSELTFPEPVTSFSVIPHIKDILHAVRIDDTHFVALFDHLYDLCGVFLVNEWGKMVESFGEGRGYVAHLQLDYPAHAAIDRKMSRGDAEEDGMAVVKSGSASCRPYNDNAFIFICDSSNNRISLFDGNLTFLKVFASNVSDPWRIGIDAQNKMLCVATIHHSVCIVKYR